MSTTNAAGSYRPTPLDFVILGLLPAKGIIGGVHWAGVPVRHLVRDINADLADGAPAVPNSTVSARIRSMKMAGLVEDFRATGGSIWAATPDGVAYLSRRGEVLGV